MSPGPQYDFEWDVAKARANLRKHRVSFEEAAAVFLDPYAVSVPDREHEDKEERWITLGSVRGGRLLVVIHTFEAVSVDRYRVRLISARTESKRERLAYEERS